MFPALSGGKGQRLAAVNGAAGDSRIDFGGRKVEGVSRWTEVCI